MTSSQPNTGGSENTGFIGAKARKPLQITLIALALGLVFEILFFGHPLGVNFLVLVVLTAITLILASWIEGIEPARLELVLSIPIICLAFLTFLRLEPLTVFLCVVLVLIGFALWVRTFRSDQICRFGWIDYLVAVVWVPLESWLRPWPTIGDASTQLIGEHRAKSRTFAILRGVLIALPILVVFIALLAAADLVFGDYVEQVIAWINLEILFEYTGRVLLIILSAIFFLGALISAIRDPGERKLIGEDKPILKPFLGFTEISVVLVAVNVLFLLFVLVQARYLFGGEANISTAGYTYSEYARRGFGELVAVGFLSLGMIMAFGYWGRRESQRQRRWFNWLSAILVVFLGVILVSALMRLLLYEEAYGFTRLRTYTHVFIIWLALLLVAFIALLFLDRLRAFSGLALAGVIGFTITLAVLNVDGFIVQQNTDRLSSTGEIDLNYLVGLSNDAVPGLVTLAETGPEDVRANLLPQLACLRQESEERRERVKWPSYHISHQRADQLLSGMSELDAYTVYAEDWNWVVEGPTGEDYCRTGYW